MVRKVYGASTTLVTSGMAAELEQIINARYVDCCPSLVGSSTYDNIRVYRPDGVLAWLVDRLRWLDLMGSEERLPYFAIRTSSLV